MYIFLLYNDFYIWYSSPNFYTKKVGDHLIIRVLYVDDFILTSSDPKIPTHVKYNLRNKFDMTNLGILHYFLGLQVLQTMEGCFLFWPECACDHIYLFHMDCKPTTSPFQSRVKLTTTYTIPKVDSILYYQLVGILLYLTHIHLDVSFFVGIFSQYMKTHHKIH
jgi:hypothetical protein